MIIPDNVLVSVLFTYGYILKDFFSKFFTLNVFMLLMSITSWIMVILGYDISYYVYPAIGCICLSIIISIIDSFTFKNKNTQYMDIDMSDNDAKLFKNVTGTVTYVYEDSDAYLGKIYTNGNFKEILVHSDDKMDINDKFIILGMFDGKFKARKKEN